MTKRTIENRLDELENGPTPEPATPWMKEWGIPKELWDDPGAAWVYSLTDGEKYPDLEPFEPGET